MPRPHDDDGTSTVEYGLMLAAIAAVLVVVLLALGGRVTGLFDQTCDAVGAKADPTATC